MKTTRFFLLALFLSCFGFATTTHADDIDVYSDNSGTTGIPNILIILDNAAGFSASATSTCTYAGEVGGLPSLGNTAGGVEQCGIYNVIYGLEEGKVNIGLMVYNNNGIHDVNYNVDGNANCSSSNGGCLVQPLELMSGDKKKAFLAWIKTWKATNSDPGNWIKASAQATGAVMQEAWAYYAGKTGISGRNYAGIQPSAGCQKNFVVFVGNAFGNTTAGDGGGSANPLTALQAAPGVTPEQLTPIDIPTAPPAMPFFTDSVSNKKYYGTTAFGCNVPHAYSMPSHTGTSGLYADEWARYMYQTDLYGGFDEKQSITTYSVGMLGADCKPDYPALLSSMAKVGGGKYFAASSYDELKAALDKILNEVQAVNSVFAAASLPVSVNAQGTFLNQIFLGMFRPDPSANPRWLGNLKQYKFILEGSEPNQTLKLGDSKGAAAIAANNTGFISPNAVSFWTKKTDGVGGAESAAPDTTGGFWVNNAQGAGKSFDSPDGELVEKGGAAQQLRIASLTTNYASTPAGPRKLYTHCPTGSGCEASLLHSSNLFATTNSGITEQMLSSVASLSVSSIVRTGTVAEVTTNTVHGFATGDTVTISGANPADYNGVKSLITKISDTKFSFTVVENPPSPATNTAATSYSVSIPSNPRAVSITRSGSIATVNLAAHGYTTGQTVTITGAAQAAYNGAKIIAVVDANNFTYTVVEGPVTPSGNGTATVGATSKNISNASGVVRVGKTVTVSYGGPNHSFVVGNLVTIAGVSVSDYNSPLLAPFTITSVGNKTFTFELPTTTPASPATLAVAGLAIQADSSAAAKAITSLTRVGNLATATVTAHGFSDGINVSVAVVGTPLTNESAYANSFNITGVTSNTFSYPIVTTPVTPATGTITVQKTGTSDRTALINWVRGEDNYGDEPGPDPIQADGTRAKGYTVRPYVHGDVLHSRPVVINYGDSRGLVVFYGANDGVFRAINGSQEDSIGAVPPGGELWGLVLKEHFEKLNRQRVNSPELRLATTPLSSSALPKDYFADGVPGVYQKVDSNGVVVEAYIYLTMRRGGRFIYALDVSTPTDPKVVWKIGAPASADSLHEFNELGQTWSRPRLTVVKGYPNPVLVFGAGYDPQEDSEPPGAVAANGMGRGIYVLDAKTGARVWKAVFTSGEATSCSGSTTQAKCDVGGMKWSIPADVSLLDRDSDGLIDRLYAADMGGNVWRVDFETSGGVTPDKWRVTKFAALGCSGGVCASGTPRKFFFPANTVSIGPVTSTPSPGSYDAVMLGSGDREHPLASSDSFGVSNRFYVLKDFNTAKDAGAPAALTEANLFDATSATYVKGDYPYGFYINFATGEKSVNASLTIRGVTYFGTNTPSPPSPTSCSANLGVAKGYALDPFTGVRDVAVYDGGGMPPSPTTGVVNVDGKDVVFCVGCGFNRSTTEDGKDKFDRLISPLEGGEPGKSIVKNPRRTYWYRK